MHAADFERLGRIRRVIAAALATIVLACSLYVFVRGSLTENKIIFRYSNPQAIPPGHVKQIEIVERLIPKGSALIYLTSEADPWQFGLWKRSLYPDYLILPLVGAIQFNSPPIKAFRQRHHIQYVLLAGVALPGAGKEVALPKYPNGRPLTLLYLGK